MELVIDVPKHTYEKIAARVEKSDFESVDGYVGFVIEEVAKEDPAVEQAVTDDDQNVRERLESLGYIE